MNAQIIILLTCSLFFVFSCSKEREFNDEELVGDWNAKRIYIFYNSDLGTDTVYNELCNFKFELNGLLFRNCPNLSDTLAWFYRQLPPKVILVDETSVFTDISIFDVLDFNRNRQTWESFEEFIQERENEEDLIISHYRSIELNRE